MRRHGQYNWIRYCLAALAELSISVVLFLGWVIFAVFAADKGVHPLVVLASVPVVAYLTLSIAQGFYAAPDAGEDDPLRRSACSVNWRLCDPTLSTFGLWRAEVECYPPDIDGFKNRKMVKEYVRSLVHHWSIRSAWPCGVLRVSRANMSMANPLEAVSEGKVYRVTLVDQLEGIRRSWICFGDGYIVFQVERGWRENLRDSDQVVFEQSKEHTAPELSSALGDPAINPLWDRWLDG